MNFKVIRTALGPVLAVVALVSLPQRPSQAQVVQATFQGTITGFTSSAVLPGLSVGDPFTVEVFYDMTPTSSSNNATVVNNVPVPATAAAYWWFGEGYTASFSFGAYDIDFVDNTQLEVRNNPLIPQRGFTFGNTNLFTSGSFSAPGGGFLSVSLFSNAQNGPTFPEGQLQTVTNYPVALFEQNAFHVAGNFGSVSADVNGTITSYNIATIPEPASLVVLLGGAGVCLVRRRR
jgi:hypothetical protein